VTVDRVLLRTIAPDAGATSFIVERARRRGFRCFLVGPADALESGPSEEHFSLEEDRIVPRSPGLPPIRRSRIGTEAELERLLREVPDGATVAVEWTGDRLIPLENLVAARGRRFRVWTFADRIEDAPGALGALEHGADRVIVAVRSPEEVDELERLLERAVPPGLDWQTVEVTAVRPAGTGDRVIVDTTSLLQPEEGLLVGSAAGFLFHVASEAVGSRFSRARPFRVNAGAAHSYVLMADGSTRYLAELAAGDSVLATVPLGGSRAVRVGRLKVERRPLVMVTAEDAGVARTLFAQEAETVRLSTEHGRVPTSAIAPGARVRGVRLPPARHLGRAVEETVEER
jgi:3-dehydroquinate synthase II